MHPLIPCQKIMKSTKSANPWLNLVEILEYYISIENTFACIVLGEHASMKNELYQTNVKSQGFIYIEPRSSTISIDLSMHVHVVKD